MAPCEMLDKQVLRRLLLSWLGIVEDLEDLVPSLLVVDACVTPIHSKASSPIIQSIQYIRL